MNKYNLITQAGSDQWIFNGESSLEVLVCPELGRFPAWETFNDKTWTDTGKLEWVGTNPQEGLDIHYHPLKPLPHTLLVKTLFKLRSVKQMIFTRSILGPFLSTPTHHPRPSPGFYNYSFTEGSLVLICYCPSEWSGSLPKALLFLSPADTPQPSSVCSISAVCHSHFEILFS